MFRIMHASQQPVSHALNLVMQIVQASDGANAKQLLEVVNEIADPANDAGREIKEYLRQVEREGLACPCGRLDCG